MGKVAESRSPFPICSLTYRGLGQAHKSVGDRVVAGEAIGSTWNEETSAGEASEMEIQFWFDGAAVNPENYIRF